MADGKGSRSRPVLACGLTEDVGEVIGDRFLADPEFLGDLTVTLASGDELDDSGLASRQVGGRLLCTGCVCPVSIGPVSWGDIKSTMIVGRKCVEP